MIGQFNKLGLALVLLVLTMLLSACETTPSRIQITSQAQIMQADSGAKRSSVAAFEFKDIPSMMVFVPGDPTQATISSLKAQLSELDGIVPAQPSTDFFNYEAGEGFLVYNNDAGKFIFDVDQQPRAGIVFSDGIKPPVYVFINDETTFYQEFVHYFSISSKEKFDRFIQRRAEKRDNDAIRKSNAEQPLKHVLNRIKSTRVPTVTEQQVNNINTAILDRFDFIYGYAFNKEHFEGDYRSLSAEITEGSWAGIHSFKRNEKGQRVSSKNVTYQGTNTADIKDTFFTYNDAGLISKITEIHYRSQLDVSSTTTFFLFWEAKNKLLVYRFSGAEDDYFSWDDMDVILTERFEFDGQYRPVKLDIFTYNGTTNEQGASNFGWTWEYKENEMVYINVRDLQPSSKSVFKYRNGKESEAIHEVLDGSYYRKDLSENGVTNSYSKDGVITNTIERVLTPGGCMSAMTKIEQGEVKERIAFKCE